MVAEEYRVPDADEPASADVPRRNGARRRALVVLILLFALIGAAWTAWWRYAGQHQESTDNAYVAAHVVQVTPQTAGTIAAIGAEDTDFVRAGQLLIRLDTADARIALEQAEADLAQAVRAARLMYASSGALAAAVTQREAELAKTEEDLKRRENLAGRGAITRESLEHSRSEVLGARAQLAQAREQLAANQVLTDGIEIAAQPGVRRAAARLRETHVALARMEIRAPVSGHIARRAVQVGQRVAAGAPLMAIVALDEVWVDANFKEAQLEHMRIGQPATLTADLYGRGIEFRGRVAGLAAGTGSAFALLPPQNASGNWVKVAQRVPVRIALDPAQLKANPLQLGLSMRVKVDISDAGGERLPAQPRAARAEPPKGADPVPAAAEARVRAIIAEHAGRAVQRAGAEPLRQRAEGEPPGQRAEGDSERQRAAARLSPP
jgi:membrane fusion protein (multidrug efflux system)